MAGIWLGIISVIKNILLKVLSAKFFEWLFFWAAGMLVHSTKTPLDDQFYEQVKKIYFDEQGGKK